ncbi:type II toxin-antitoxin system VapB family antitoxin [uncultured Arcticibacterium sp.]|uniref:type II toxin-antitoxin system VapB family antitoxin n=1 Tax=uncultured Arcticibacterium sp. TaxID=2173042 RepID=UPI0030F580A8
MRTNIEIDQKKIEVLRQLTGLKTEKDIVDQALEAYIAKMSKLALFEMKGKVSWKGDLKLWRSPKND